MTKMKFKLSNRMEKTGLRTSEMVGVVGFSHTTMSKVYREPSEITVEWPGCFEVIGRQQ